MGQASAVCSKSPNIPNTDGFNFIFTCSENYMLDEVFSVGIQSLDDQDPSSFRHSLEDIEDYCYMEPEMLDNPIYKNIRWDNLEAKIIEECKGKTQCTPMILYEDVVKSGRPDPPPTSLFFAQVSCKADPDRLPHKKTIALICSCTGLLICLLFTSTVTYVQNSTMIKEQLLDYELVSIEDYSVSCKINQRLYRKAMNATRLPDG